MSKPGKLLFSEKRMGPSNEIDQQPCSSKLRESEHSVMKKLRGVITARQDDWVKIIMAKRLCRGSIL